MRDTADIMRERQRAIRREIDRRGIALKAIEFDAGISNSTLLSYFPGGDAQPAVIPMSAVFRLIEGKALPLDLISMLLPVGFLLVRVPEEVDFDEIDAHCRAFVKTKAETHREDSPDRRDIAPCERDTLNGQVARLRAVVG
ncbi:hypothetical protein SLG_21850 [Sphingobium sp. SYK-6]|uniref:hypothetical protein n=1 Tax=Sphingobium sp. (strain NBRC 103272 / SYK-6) TaxID=627192 RepID=UPI00022770B4|nr:hypothetical protein [Sphingobium sp. SYK-6]BAK66860.1 hypothetical protein SLG_21850 [Sphingobium sp. SYK-6]